MKHKNEKLKINPKTVKLNRKKSNKTHQLTKKDTRLVKKSPKLQIVKKKEPLQKKRVKKPIENPFKYEKSKLSKEQLTKLMHAKDKLVREDKREDHEKLMDATAEKLFTTSEKIGESSKKNFSRYQYKKRLKKEDKAARAKETKEAEQAAAKAKSGDSKVDFKELKDGKEKYTLKGSGTDPSSKLQYQKTKAKLQSISEKEKLNRGNLKIKKEGVKKQEKEFHRWQKNSKLQIERKSSSLSQKKQIKKNIYRNKQNQAKKQGRKAASTLRERMASFFKKDIKQELIKSTIQSKLLAGAGSFLILILPFFLCVAIIASTLGVFNLGGSEDESSVSAVSKNLSPDVERWRSLVEKEAKSQGMEKFVDVLLALIQVETGGRGTKDIMQSSESAGLPVNSWATEEQSVHQGVKHLKNVVELMKGYGKGYESNVKFIVQAYNFGSAFVSYVHRTGGNFSLEVAEKYSRDVVAPSLGNHTGATYSYVNDVSVALGKTYLYWNGGNYMYHELVAQYLTISTANITGDFKKVMDELEKYQGMPYVFGGKSPATGFDCSGLVSYGLAQIGIQLPSYTVDQWNQTVPVSREEAQPGDLIFFKGTYSSPDFISHVGFYIDPKIMFDSNDSGVGYHDWSGSYWQSHFAGIRRVKR